MNLVRKSFWLYFTLLPILILSACATDVSVPIIVPAGLDIGMERLSVYPVKDAKTRLENSVATRELENVFVNADIEGKKVFNIIALSKLGTIQEQQQLERQAYSGSFDQSTVSVLHGKGVQGLVMTVLDEESSSERSRIKVERKELNCMTRIMNSIFHTRILDTATAQIIMQRSYPGKSSRTVCDGTEFDSSINVELAKEARVEALDDLRKDIVPYKKKIKYEMGMGAILRGVAARLLVDVELLSSSTGPRSTRVFSDRKSYPPEKYAAYGIVAFGSRATDETRQRYLTICKAYVASIPHRSELKIPTEKQMVTVWPIESAEAAFRINAMIRKKVCDHAVDTYDLATSLTALGHASLAGAEVNGPGPYLLGWSPAFDKGKRDALVLVKDMSNVNTSVEAINTFVRWRKEIESDPKLWESGWNLESTKTNIRQFVDFYGPQISELLD